MSCRPYVSPSSATDIPWRLCGTVFGQLFGRCSAGGAISGNVLRRLRPVHPLAQEVVCLVGMAVGSAQPVRRGHTRGTD